MKVNLALRKFVAVLTVAFLAAISGYAFAGTAAVAPAVADAPSQAPDTPPDCKKTPDDPRCKSKPY